MKKHFPQLLVLALVVFVVVPSTGCSKSARKARHLSRGDTAFAAGGYDVARIEYLNVLKADSQNAHAIGQLGIMFHDSGLFRQAAPFLARAKELDPTNTQVRLKLSQLLLLAGQRDKAREDTSYILEKDPANPEAVQLLIDLIGRPEDIPATQQSLDRLRQRAGDRGVFHLAQANLSIRKNDLQTAEAEVNQALALDPKLAAAHSALAAFHLQRTNLVAAEQEMNAAADLSPVRSGRRIRYAELMLRNGKSAEGRALLESLTKQAPDFIPAWTALASLSFDQKRYDDSLSQVDRVLSRDPLDYDAGVLRARIRMAKNDPAKAVEELDPLAKVYSRSGELRYNLALACLANQNLDEALNHLNASIALSTNAVEPVLLLARLNIGKGDFNSAIDSLTQLLRRQPNLPGVQLALGEAYTGRGRFEDALAVYQGFAKAHPRDPQGPFLAGLVQRQQNNTAEARRSFEQALQLDPKDLAATAQLVELDLVAQEKATALSRATAAVEAMPESSRARMLLAFVQLSLGDTRPAELELKKAIELDPEAHGAYVRLAQLYVSTKQQGAALKQLDSLLAKTPADTAALMVKATLLSEAKDYAKARDAYEKLLASKPDFPAALNNLAYLCSENLARPDRAYELARKARTLSPQDPAVADTLGWVMYRRGEYREALALFRESAAKLQAEPDVLYHLGMGHYMMGQEDAARSAFDRALKSQNDSPNKADARSRLAILSIDPEAENADRKVIQTLQSALDEHPGDSVAARRLAAIYERDRNWTKAKAVYEAVLKANPKSVPILISLARLNAGPLNDRPRGMDLARTARNLAQDDPEVAHTLGQLAFRAGDHSWALSLLQEAAQKLPTQPAVLYDLAWAQFSVGHLAEAEAANQNALRLYTSERSTPPLTPALSPSDAERLAARPGEGFAQVEAAKKFAAMLSLCTATTRAPAAAPRVQQILKSDPNYAPALVVAALLYQQRGQLDAARNACELVLVRFPLFTPATRQLARLYLLDPPDYQKAYDHGLKARQAYPDDPEVAHSLGIAFYKRADAGRAVSLLQESLRKQPADAEALYYLGLSHLQLKDTNSAREALQKVATDPSGPFAPEAKKALSAMK